VLGIAVIGCGLISQSAHLPHLAAASDVELVAVCDRDPYRLALARDRFGVRVAESDYRAVLARSDVDAVVVATEDASHARIAADCVAAGKHVFVEKPLCLAPDEADALVADLAAAGLIGAVGYHKVHDGAVAWLRENLPARPFLLLARDICHDNGLVLEQVLPPELLDEAFRRGSSDYERSSAWDAIVARWFPGCPPDRAASYRVFLNLACHDLATVIALYGEPTGVQHAELWGPPDHRGTFIYEYGPEARFVLTVALTDRSWFDQSLRLYTPTATADISWPSPFVDSGLTQARVQRLIDGEETVTTANAPSYQAFREELRDFLWAIVDGHAPRSPFSLGAAVLRWQFEALKLDHARRR
jgi:predicted dehydrogenase